MTNRYKNKTPGPHIAPRGFLTLSLLLLLAPWPAKSQLDKPAALALIQRTVPTHAANFTIEALPATAGRDSFELESRANRIVLHGNNGVAIASALYYYLDNFCHNQITWNGSNLHLPASLPRIPVTIRKASPYTWRYYLNY